MTLTDQTTNQKAKKIKDKILIVRISGEDKNQIALFARQANISMSEFLISSALRRKLPPAKIDVNTYVTLAQMLWEIKKIGNNFNQLVKTCHISKQVGEPVVVDTNVLLNVNNRLSQATEVIKTALKKME
jgi:hypothetical protein